MKFVAFTLLFLTLNTSAQAQVNFRDLVFAGYQGWFAAEGDGSMNQWLHWSGQNPRPGKVTFELYPDTREYAPTDLFQTGLGPLGNQTPSRLYSSNREGVVDLHFKWMYQYGIDGVGLQRFVNEIREPRFRQWRDGVADKVRRASERWKRFFYITYDISGANGPTLVEDIQRDFTEVIEKQLRLPWSPYYARQMGNPVVGLWGFGVGDRPGNQEQALRLIRWFQGRGYFVMGGVPWHWRNERAWMPVYLAFNMIQPWAVGAYASFQDVDSHAINIWPVDKQVATAAGVDYQRVIFPGFSWSNWNGGKPNMIPRRAGEFFWRQAVHVVQQRLSTFIAMFDEYDEGTAIAKAAEDRSMVPVGQPFLTLDADGVRVDSDFYLRLAGAATLMIKGARPLTPAVPIPLRLNSR